MNIVRVTGNTLAALRRMSLLWQIVLAIAVLLVAGALTWDWLQERDAARNHAWNNRYAPATAATSPFRLVPLDQ